MALTVEEIESRILQLQDGIDSVSEVSFEGETTKYRSIAEIKKGIAYYTKLKESFVKRSRFRAFHQSIDRGL